ncbi:hypothetical protein BJF89_01090 [Corynebacterium sp. CNJ-954]|nr:hypothetical protein BJF89_01090 [Corynebacterium sp. CNJ-954]
MGAFGGLHVILALAVDLVAVSNVLAGYYHETAVPFLLMRSFVRLVFSADFPYAKRQEQYPRQ